MTRVLIIALLWGIPGLAAAQGSESALAGFDRCLAQAVGSFETDLRRTRSAEGRARFEIVRRDPVAYCGTLAIVACDRSDAPLPCQSQLAEAQRARSAQVLSALPVPEDVAGRDGLWSDRLYPRVWAVARGRSAGPDCAGADDAYVAWCETHQASLKLAEAVMVWQVARVLRVAEGAVEAGWADAPPPPMPVPRPVRGGGQ